jgi:threonine/homoserine/homoserine lactone efflux protein
MKLLLAGFVLSLLGSLPPGLINLSVAYIAIRRSFFAAMALGAGAAFAEYFQALIAVALVGVMPTFKAAFEWVAAVLFLSLGIYLLLWPQKPGQPDEIDEVSIQSYFNRGVLISIFNLLAIPYWVTYCSWLQTEGWWSDKTSDMLIFAAGVSIGTIGAFGLYAWFSTKILQRVNNIAKIANLVIGLTFLGLAVKLLFQRLWA